MKRYPWPGNVRELENIMQRLVLLYDGSGDINQVVDELLNSEISAFHLSADNMGSQVYDDVIYEPRNIEKQQASYKRSVIVKTNFNMSQAAKLLGISRSTLHRKIRELNLDG